MSERVELVRRGAAILLAEVDRRAVGEPADPTLDVPLAVLVDVAESREGEGE